MITRLQFINLIFFLLVSISAMGQTLSYATYLDRAGHISGAELLVENPKEEDATSANHIFKEARPALVYGREDRSDIEGSFWSYRISYDLLDENTNILDNGQLLIRHRADDGIYEDFDNYSSENIGQGEVKLVITNVEASIDDFATIITDPLEIAEVIPEDIRLELRMEVTQYDDLPTNVSMAFLEHDDFDVNKDEVEVRWRFLSGADFYELEWAYIDEENLDYDDLVLPAAQEAIFKNATRVEVFAQHYKIPLSYPKGKVYYRVRPVGRFTQNISGDYSHLKFGLWTARGPILIDTGFEEDFNWQFTSTFAEEGKYKKVISYFDDGLRNRQTQTNLSTEEVSLVATAHYDVEGRPTVNVLPVPAINNNDLFYKPRFNRSASDNTQTYNRRHFDKSLGDLCNGTPPDQLSNTLNGDGLGGAAYYFSSNYGNDVNAQGIHKEYLPDAGGYPMTQVRYLNDGTGRLAYQSGVGEFYQLGNGKETRYFYDDPSEKQLKRLFGNNVGDAKYYKRNVVMDANGQMSVSYIDAAGRVIATALTGVVPDNVNALESAGTAEYNVEENLLANNVREGDGEISKTISTVLNEQEGQVASFHYSFTGANTSVTIDNGQDNETCISCIYELSINVYSPCGIKVDVELADDTNGDGVLTIGDYASCDQIFNEDDDNDNTLPTEYYIADFTVTMDEIGLYRIEKVLKVIRPDLDAIETLLTDLLPTITDINVPINYLECAETCTEYCNLTLDGATIEEIEACINSCEQEAETLINQGIARSCDFLLNQMLDQVSPGGCLFDGGTPWWETIPGYLTPPIVLPVDGGDPIAIITQTDAETYLLDESMWEDGWEEAVVVLHPEYCHYLLCTGSDPSTQFNYDFGRMEDWQGTTWPNFDWATVQLIVNNDPMFNPVLGFYPSYDSNSDLTNEQRASVEDAIEDVLGQNNLGDNFAIAADLNALFIGRLEDFGSCSASGSVANIVDHINNCLANQTTLSNEERWRFFKSLYLGEKLKLAEELRREWCQMGEGDCALTEDHELFDVPSPNESGSQATEDALNAYTGANSVDMCGTLCALRVEEWMQTILIENNELEPGTECTISEQDIIDIRAALSEYCFDNCNPGNPLAYLLNEEIAALLADIDDSCIASIITTSIAVPFLEVYECYQVDEVDVMASTVAPCISSMFVELNTILADPTANCISDLHEPNNLGCFSQININGNEIYLSGSNLCCNNIELTSVEGNVDVDLCGFDYFGAPWVDGTNVFVNAYEEDIVHGILTETTLSMTCFNNNYQENYAPDLLANNLNDCIIFNDCIAIPIETPPPGDECIEQLIAENITIREHILNEEINSILSGVIEDLECNDYTEVFTVSYPSREHHYTLYYYDQAGNLVQTVPPEGVKPLADAAFTAGIWDGTSMPAHEQQTRYRYNTLGQVVWQYSPDGDEVNFKYDYAQRLRVSQNGRQRVNVNNGNEDVSYTKYDSEGRIVEVGELDITPGSLTFNNIDETQLNDPDFPSFSFGNRYDVTRTEYNGTGDSEFLQTNTRSRVSRSLRYIVLFSLSITPPSVIDTRYSYDEHGNVKSLWHKLLHVDRDQQIDYEYDLISGNVKEVAYQKGKVDQYSHRYEYDADNRLTSAFTSEDNIIWDKDAYYQYYMHGPLARVELGNDKVQGTDYYYTLQGWIKGVNMPGHKGHQVDPGEDGNANENGLIGRDAMAYGLGYYRSDYQTIGTNTALGAMSDGTWTGFSNALKPDVPDQTNPLGLYNGNISWMLTDIPSLNESDASNEGLRGMAYQYDQLHRILQAKSYGATATANNSITWDTDNFYDSKYTYDSNGNLKTLRRNTKSGDQFAVMDNLTYKYEHSSIPNRLTSVSEGLVDVIPNDPSVTSQPDNNYEYDDIGNLIKDNQEGTTILWDVYGKVKTVAFDNPAEGGINSIYYLYDAAGNRITKYVNRIINNVSTSIGTYYVRDASGNILSIYEGELSGGDISGFRQKEVPLYGSSRLGQRRFTDVERVIPHPDDEEVYNPNPPLFTQHIRNRGKKHFECSNHLGNVLTVVTDKKIGIEINDPIYLDDRADYYLSSIVSTSDYYPFGYEMPDRTVQSGEYRYGFNGKEKDENQEWGSQTHYDYGFRIYNPGIGKFLSVDPLMKKYPKLTPYQFASNRPIEGIDLDGLEYFSNKGWNMIFQGMEINNETVYGKTLGQWERSSNEEKYHAFVYFALIDLPTRYGMAVMEIEGLKLPKFGIPTVKPRFKIPKIKVKKKWFKKVGDWFKKNPYDKWKDPGEASRPLKPVLSKWAGMKQPGDEIEFFIKEGRIMNKKGKPVSGEFDFVYDRNGSLKIGDGHFYLSGNDVNVPTQMAGDIRLKDGFIEEAGVGSGHFRFKEDFGEIAIPQYFKKSTLDLSKYKFRDIKKSEEVTRKLGNGELKVERKNATFKE